MSIKNIIQVSEFEKLYYDDTKPFKQKHWDALCRYLESVNRIEEKRKEYFRVLKSGIQFTNFVGVIQAGDLTIEILPKTDKGSTTAANKVIADLEKSDSATATEKSKWHNVLLQMLKECRLIKVNHVDYANLKLRSNSILDIYIELFLLETEKLMHEGLIKKYNKKEGNQQALKGQLQFQKQATINCTHHERFYVRYTEYNRDNIFNQIIYNTLFLIPKINNNPFFIDYTSRLLLDFPEVANISATEATFDKLQYDRKSERYKEALLICKMLLLNYRPDITGGRENVIAILFDMNKLWEEFIYRRLKREEANYAIQVLSQRSKDFWQAGTSNTVKKIRPDMVINYKRDAADSKYSNTLIIDTKWKNNEDLNPADDDLKQMFIYNLYWNCEKSILLYPSSKDNALGGTYHKHPETELQRGCGVQVVSILDINTLSKDIGDKILCGIGVNFFKFNPQH